MGLGVLEDTKLDHVPGTTFVLDEQTTTEAAPPEPDPNLKYDRSGPTPVILVPQPSDDPNDPLNWPLWRRDLILGILSFAAVVCSTTSPLLAANTQIFTIYYQVTFTDSALLTGYHLCGVGIAGILCVPTARVWGKRHLFVFATVIMIITCAWAGRCANKPPGFGLWEGKWKSYNSLTAARFFQGFGLAPFEALVNAAVGDLFFVHERGKRMAISNVAVFGGAFLTPVIVGKITVTMGWKWTFYFIAIIAGATLPFIILFVPETAFRRADHLNTDFEGDSERSRLPNSGAAAPSSSSEEHKGPENSDEQPTPENRNPPAAEAGQTTIPPKDTFLQSLRLFNGRKTDENFFKLLLRPFPLFFHPAVMWACLIQGVIIGWTTFIGVVLAALYLGPPLWFGPAETGYMYTGAFIGSMIGLVICGLIADRSANIMIKWNKGKYEPEFRIVLVLPQLLFCGIGLYGFGYVTEDTARYGWLPTEVFFMFVLIGMVVGTVVSALYVVDAHRQISVEIFTCLLMFKNMFCFVLTYFAYDWVIHIGPKHVFVVLGSIQVGLCMLSVPMYIFGKWNRSFFHRHDILKMLHLW